ncbi:MAG: YcaQ family DNA glycosylase [Acidobacteria bacterium]|nr:YcaQ family DNA glycosylase [Acidobacteriota bacterium]
MSALPLLPAPSARRLFLGAQGLLTDPSRRATLPALEKLIGQLGFVQLDTINVLARAHDLTLFTRLRGYRPGQLSSLLARRALFEAFTHDASVIPSALYPHWKPRHRRDAARMRRHAWWTYHFRGTDPEAVLAGVRERIVREGPLMSKDFEHPEKRGPWWGWKPQKAALDFLWRSGELAIAGRVNFHKVYDLAERVHPEGHGAPEPSPGEHREWACGSAAERLGVFTPRELAGFWEAVDLAEARAWCAEAARQGRIVPVEVGAAKDAAPQRAFALADWECRLRALPDPPEGLRLLSPFDPVVRDRDRALRRFGFDYRFEAFVPEPKRVFGYYVLPLLEGERLVGRLDAKLHRDRDLLEVRGLWWEPGVKATTARRRSLREALEGLAAWLGAEDMSGPGF